MRFLFIRPGALGDTLLAFPVIAALRASSSAPHVTLVGNRAVLPLARACGLADAVADYEEPRWSALFASPPSRQAWLSNIDWAIAWLHDPDNLVYQNLQAAGISQITVTPGRPPVHERMHIVDYLARSVGVTTDPEPYYGDCFSVAAGPTGRERAFAIHPGSGGARKCWPPERFAAVISWLWQQEQPVLLFSGPADQERLEVLLKLLPEPPRPALLRLLVDVPLLDLVPMLCQCRGYLGNDAGMTHLAALLGLPTLALFGPTDPLIWQPRGRSVSIIHEPHLERLEVERVIEWLAGVVMVQGNA